MGEGPSVPSLFWPKGRFFSFPLPLPTMLTNIAPTFPTAPTTRRCSEATIDAAMDRAVTSLFPFVLPGSRVLDVGSGWCGPLGIFADSHACNVTGVTISSGQAAHCREEGRDIVLGDIEANDTQAVVAAGRGPYDAALLIESLTHVQDKPALLRWLRTQAPRLILRVNTRPDDDVPAAQAPPVVFGDSMDLPTAGELRQVRGNFDSVLDHFSRVSQLHATLPRRVV